MRLAPIAPRIAAGALAIALTLGCATPLGRELWPPTVPLHRADAIVVLGNRPVRGRDGRIAPEPARRVRRGVALFEEGLAPRLLVTGGPTSSGATESEADVLAAYAEARGVPRAAILLEREARDTIENARRSVALLCRGRARCRPSVIVVTSPYHLRRAARAFTCAGADVQWSASELAPDLSTQAAQTAYEYAVGVVQPVGMACARAAAR